MIVSCFLFLGVTRVYGTYKAGYLCIDLTQHPVCRLLSASAWSHHWFLRPGSYTPESGPASARLGWYAWVWKMQFTDVMLNISWYWTLRIRLRVLPYLCPRSEGCSSKQIQGVFLGSQRLLKVKSCNLFKDIMYKNSSPFCFSSLSSL